MKHRISFLITGVLAVAQIALPQIQGDTKQRAHDAHEFGKQGDEGISKLAPYVTDTDISVRVEAVKALTQIGGPKTVDLLVKAAGDSDPEVQIRATDALVNVYLPGFIKDGISASLRRAGNSVKARFSDTNSDVIDPYVMVRPDVIEALGKLAVSGATVESRANACRALGILRAQAAIPQIAQAMHSKDSQTIYEGLVALEKIRDPASATHVTFLVRDLDEKIQLTAIEAAGLLLDKEAAPDLREVIGRARSTKVRRAATSSLAMLADQSDHATFLNDLGDLDDGVRAAGAEGLGRLKQTADIPALQKAYMDEHHMNARLAECFALVMLGKTETTAFSPLRYLIDTLNQKSYQGVAVAYLIELARAEPVRQALYPILTGATKEERMQLGTVLARSGDGESKPYLEAMSKDPDLDVAQAGVRDLRTLQARLP